MREVPYGPMPHGYSCGSGSAGRVGGVGETLTLESPPAALPPAGGSGGRKTRSDGCSIQAAGNLKPSLLLGCQIASQLHLLPQVNKTMVPPVRSGGHTS